MFSVKDKGTDNNSYTCSQFSALLQGPRSKFSTGGAIGERVSVSQLRGEGGTLPRKILISFL